jgi:hypothetical protein
MFATILNILQAGLSLWDSKEKTKYVDKLIKLKKDYYVEYNKENPDHAALDCIEFELLLLGHSFASKVGTKDALDVK